MAVQLTYTGTPFADQIRQQGFRPGGILSVAPRQIFSTTNPAFASTYGTPINLATSTRAFSLPSFNFSSGVSGKEVIQSPKAATKGMRLAEMAERLKNVSPTAKNLLAGKTVSGFGGGVAAPGILRSLFSLPMAAVTAGPQVISSLMAPKTEAGFDYMKNFDKGAITGVFDETAGLDDFQQFGKDLVAVDAANQASVNQGGIIDATPVGFASQMNAERNVGVPQDNRFTGIMRNIARGPLFQGGLQAGLKAGEIVTGGLSLPFALAGGIASQFLPLDRRPSNLDYQYVNQPGGVNVVDNKITTGVLSGKNFASGFGSNNLGTMYQDYIDTMTGRGMVTDEFGNLVFDEEELTDNQKQKLKDAKAELNAYLTTGSKIRGYRDSVRGRTMTPREFAFNYNQGIGQFAMPTTDVTGKALDYTGESDTYAGGESTPGDDTSYSDPYDPGGGE